MSTYMIGDVQGCFESLLSLLETMDVQAGDRICLVGDLVNRGPRSLDVLNWAMKRDDQVQIVLGNHDLHLIACHYGAEQERGDTLQSTLEAENAEDIITWLRHQPLLWEAEIEGQRIAMVHAGINPKWSWDEVRARSKKVEESLRSKTGGERLAAVHPKRKAHLSRPQVPEPWLEDLGWLTRVRAIDREHQPDWGFKGALSELPDELTPWFVHYEQLRDPMTTPDHLYFGHWAALGLRVSTSYTALDSGCIWGRYLSAVRVEDGAIFQVPTIEEGLTPKNQRYTNSERVGV